MRQESAKRKTLVVCDVEGTIFKAEFQISGVDYAAVLYHAIAESLGSEAVAEEKSMADRYENLGHKSYLDWVEDTARMHLKYGLNAQTFNFCVESAKYMPGVQQFFSALDRELYVPILISGGFQNLIARAQTELNIQHGTGAVRYIFDKAGKLFGYELHNCDFAGKLRYIEWFFDHYDLDSDLDWLFVGDGKNDKDIASRAPLSFGIDPHPQLAEVVDYRIRSFLEVAEVIKQSRKYGRSGGARSPRARVLATGKEDVSLYLVSISEDDYLSSAHESLMSLLDVLKVGIVSSTKNQNYFTRLTERHENVQFFDYLALEHCRNEFQLMDFVFVDCDCLDEIYECHGVDCLSEVSHAEVSCEGDINAQRNAISSLLTRHFHVRECANSDGWSDWEAFQEVRGR